jgi:hypothetical protein
MMVDVTYQMVLSTIQTIALVVGIIYYLTIMRNQQRSQKHAEDTRKIQLLMQLYGSQNVDWSIRRQEVINMDFKDLDDFWEKADRPTFAKVGITWSEWNILGLLLKNGFIDDDMMFEFLQYRGPIYHWERYGEIIKEMRIRHGFYSLGTGFEYLAEKMTVYREKQGHMFPQHDTQSLMEIGERSE